MKVGGRINSRFDEANEDGMRMRAGEDDTTTSDCVTCATSVVFGSSHWVYFVDEDKSRAK